MLMLHKRVSLVVVLVLVACAGSLTLQRPSAQTIQAWEEIEHIAQSGEMTKLQVNAITFLASFGLPITGDGLEDANGPSNLRCEIALSSTDKSSLEVALKRTTVTADGPKEFVFDARWSLRVFGPDGTMLFRINLSEPPLGVDLIDSEVNGHRAVLNDALLAWLEQRFLRTTTGAGSDPVPCV